MLVVIDIVDFILTEPAVTFVLILLVFSAQCVTKAQMDDWSYGDDHDDDSGDIFQYGWLFDITLAYNSWAYAPAFLAFLSPNGLYRYYVPVNPPTETENELRKSRCFLRFGYATAALWTMLSNFYCYWIMYDCALNGKFTSAPLSKNHFNRNTTEYPNFNDDHTIAENCNKSVPFAVLDALVIVISFIYIAFCLLLLLSGDYYVRGMFLGILYIVAMLLFLPVMGLLLFFDLLTLMQCTDVKQRVGKAYFACVQDLLHSAGTVKGHKYLSFDDDFDTFRTSVEIDEENKRIEAEQAAKKAEIEARRAAGGTEMSNRA
jgi:hypothetical protein